jgi:hypothetical protein
MRSAIFCCLVAFASLDAGAAPKVTCHDSQRYLIAGREPTDQVGTDFLVKYKRKGAPAPVCDFVARPGDLEIPDEFAEYFFAVQGNLLILDSGTGPDPRGLIFWDLDKRKKVYSTGYSDADLGDGYVDFWLETGGATDSNCPEKKEWESHGLGAAIETRVRLSLKDFNLTKSAQTRCRPRQ